MVLVVEMEELNRDEEITDAVGLGCALELFKERDEVIGMIDNLNSIYTSSTAKEVAYERFVYILGLYQEQPHLLDAHLDSFLDRLVSIVRNPDSPLELKHETFKYLHIIMKVRGYKVVVRHLPHEVSDIEPVLKILESHDPSDKSIWQTHYVLVLWLSIIVMIPFHMSRLDSFKPGEEHGEKKSVMQRILDVCKMYTVSTDVYSFTAFLTSHFLTRSDVKDIHLAPFLEWACDCVAASDSTAFERCGSLAAMAAILKHGKREDLIPHASYLLRRIQESNCRESHNTLLRKFRVKVLQRIGLTFLKTRVAVWRYRRGCRSLTANLSAGDGRVGKSPVLGPESSSRDEEQSDEFDIPEEMEEVIEELMQGLKDSDTVIRWSAAKGIGRVTGRLPQELADEVVGSVLELFSPRESDGAWHGGCLALAELGRRGLLLPERLPAVVPVVLKALVYDEPRGYFSVGTHIRDAACYVCWAFARAYDTEVLKPFVKDIASALLVVAVFDREINCRRAASAAFQENVGRQGTFPHGIEILTTADYFAVGVRNNAFLNISVYIAQFEEYTLPLINHLIERKVDHWDTAVRELSAKALHNLTPKAVSYMSQTVLSTLLLKTNSIDLNVRHGAVLAIGEILHALANIAAESGQGIQNIVDAAIIEQVKELVPRFRQRQQFRGLGGELMKQACASLIEKCSLAMMPFHGNKIIEDWQCLLDECLCHEVSNIRARAAASLPSLFTQYYHSGAQVNVAKRDAVLAKYTEQLTLNNQVTRMGFALALGSFPKFMLEGQLHVVIPALITCAQPTDSTAKWAESRRDALKALSSVCLTVGVQDLEDDSAVNVSCAEYLEELYQCFLNGLKEYTLDSRGDIGAWVREAAMSGLQLLTGLVVRANPKLLQPELVSQVMVNVSQQAVEKIDRTRKHAGKVFSSLLHSRPMVPHIPYYTQLLEILPAGVCEDQIIWISAQDTFPRFTQLLAFPPYTYHIMSGLIVSVGGITESLVKHSSSSLFSYLKGLQDNYIELKRLCDTVVEIFGRNQFDDRIIVPLFKFLDRLMGSGCIRPILDDPESMFAPDILKLVKQEITKTREVTKLMGSVEVLCQLVQVNGSVSRTSLVQLCIFLCNRFLWVRKMTASRLYESLMLYGEDSVIPPDNLDDVMTILSDTNWEQEVVEVKPTRNKLCELMGVPIPKVSSKKTPS